MGGKSIRISETRTKKIGKDLGISKMTVLRFFEDYQIFVLSKTQNIATFQIF